MRTKATRNRLLDKRKEEIETRYRRGFHEERVSLCAGILAALLTSALSQHEANFDRLIPEEDSLGTIVSKWLYFKWPWSPRYDPGPGLGHVFLS